MKLLDIALGRFTNWNSSNGAAHVNTAPAPTAYTGDISYAVAGTSVALAPGVGRITLANTDAVNFGRFAFGTSGANAIANAATGKRIFPNLAANTNTSTITRRVPVNATHFALVADTAAILVDTQQEV